MFVIRAFTSFLLLISYPKRCSLLKCNLSSSSFPLYINKAFSSVFLLRFFKNKPFHRKKIIEVIILYPYNKLQRQPFSYSFHLEKVIKKSPARDASIYSSTLSQGYNLKDKIFRLPKHLLYLLQMYIHDVPNSHLFLLKL